MRLNGKRGRVGSSPLSGEEVGRVEPPDMEQMDPRDPLTDYPRGRSLAEGGGPDEVELDEERRSPSRPADLSGAIRTQPALILLLLNVIIRCCYYYYKEDDPRVGGPRGH
jgi:hypothetical protein